MADPFNRYLHHIRPDGTVDLASILRRAHHKARHWVGHTVYSPANGYVPIFPNYGRALRSAMAQVWSEVRAERATYEVRVWQAERFGAPEMRVFTQADGGLVLADARLAA